MSEERNDKQNEISVPSGELPLAFCGLRGADNQASPLEESCCSGEKRNHLTKLGEYEFLLQEVRNLTISFWGYKARGIFLVGRSALIELADLDEEVNDLDILIVGITQEELIDEQFLVRIRETYDVEVVKRVDITYLRVLDKQTRKHIADIDVPYKPTDQLASVAFAMQRMTTCLEAIEIVERGYYVVSAYDYRVSLQGNATLALPLAPGIQGEDTLFASSMVRYQREVARTPFCTTTLDTLNAIRAWWLRFRNTSYEERELSQVSESVEAVIRKGFEDANRYDRGELFFALLCHTGTLHAVFPVAWACCSHRLTDPEESESIIGYLRENGYSLQNLGKAMSRFMEEDMEQNIGSVATSHDIELTANWHTSLFENYVVLSCLQSQEVNLGIFVLGGNGRISIYDLMRARRPSPSLEGVEAAQYRYWNIIGVYVESYLLAEVFRLEALLAVASGISGVERSTSTFDRYGVMYERVQTHFMRMMARGNFEQECERIFQINEKIDEQVLEDEKRLLEFYGLGKPISDRIARFSVLFRMHLATFYHVPKQKIDSSIHSVILAMFKSILPSYPFIFD
jgi:hypothetical protein